MWIVQIALKLCSSDQASTSEQSGSFSGRDLGGVSRDIKKIIDSMRIQLPRGLLFAAVISYLEVITAQNACVFR
jgi:hypothetical protein